MAPPPGLCEPNLYIPRKVDIDGMRKELAAETQAKDQKQQIEAGILIQKSRYSQEPIDTKIIPKFECTSEDVKANLSLQRNDYLRQRFNQFLDNPPETMFKVRLYRDLRAKKIQPRPLTLNGNFYDIKNKLAPIPHIPDPRQYELKIDATKGKEKPDKII